MSVKNIKTANHKIDKDDFLTKKKTNKRGMHKLKQLEKFGRQNILLKSNELAVECVVKKGKSNKELRIIDFQRYINEKLEELDYKVGGGEFEGSSNRRGSKRKKKNPYGHQYKLPPGINPDSL